MEERIKQNINRIKELTNELIEIYQKRAGAIEKENVDRIHAEIKTRTVLDKIYTKRELNESNLISLYNCVSEIEAKQDNYNGIYDSYEECLLFSSYDMYKNEISEIMKQKENSGKFKKIFSRRRKKW